jgi:hypothetical protein
MAISSDAHQVYDPEVQLKWQRLVSKGHLDRPFYSEMMPFAFPLVAPLALLPIEWAYFAWLVICLPIGFGGFYFFLVKCSALSKTQIPWVLIGTFLSLPVILSLSIGQNGILLLGLASLFFCFLVEKKDIPAALVLTFSSFKPHYSLFLAMAALAQRRWKLILWAGLFELVLFIVTGLTIGWHNIFAYPSIIAKVETAGGILGVDGRTMVSVMGPLACLVGQSTALSMSTVVMVAGLAATYWIWSRYQTFVPTKQRLAMALTMLLCLVTSPHSHAYDLPMLAIIAVTLPTIDFTKIIRSRPFSCLIWSLIVYFYPIASWVAGLLVIYQELATTLLYFIMNAILLACGFHLLVERVNQDVGLPQS